MRKAINAFIISIALFSVVSIDSMKSIEAGIDGLLEESWALRRSHPDSAFSLANLALKFSIEHDYKSGIGDGYSRLGILLQDRGEYQEALEKFIESLRVRELLRDYRGMAKAYNNIGSVHLAMNNLEEAEEYLTKALNLRESKKQYEEMGRVWLNLGNVFASEKMYLAADSCYRMAMLSFETESDFIGLATVFNNRGNSFYEQGEYNKALELYEKASTVHSKNKNWRGQSSSLNNMGVVQIELGQFDMAVNSLTASIAIADSLGTLDIETDAYYNLYWLHDTLGDYATALLHYERFDSLENQLLNIEKNEAILRLEAEYETEKKERENVELRAANAEKDAAQKRQAVSILWLIIALIFVAAGGGFMYYRQRQKAVLAAKNEHIKQQEVDDLMQRQELTAMGAMMEGQEKERKRIAQDLHDRIGSQLAAVKLNMEALQDKVEKGQEEAREQFGKTYGLIDGLVDEVRKISHNMVSGVLMKFGLEAALLDLAEHITGSGKVKVDVHVFNLDERVDAHVEITIYRIVQELVANALKHAQGNAIAISLNRQDGNLNVMVEDNGKGFDLTKVKKGMGLENVRQRAATLDGELNIDARPGRGTTVIVDIPIA